ncbi:hypothetical protein [Burkholderia cenocepacia]|uniref:hypothetical protein n=1 Tax=Burkholderia cenocepacia TaxID=95486 RepID=UPI0019049FA0|nr:hypothetical protein [Burkholderia cenocepacia]MBJ9895266.1 hypothetical protein [Burkholderia cenocepacia]MBJ9917630.1 hypothetical protein [Burkholderia cenocepacia]
MTLDLDLTPIAGGHYSDCNTDFAWLAYSAARRTNPDRECEWKCDDVDNGTWESCCGEIWTFTDGGPVENGMLFCHRCGSKLKTAPSGPTPQQLAALDRLAENERELGLDYMVGTDGEKL